MKTIYLVFDEVQISYPSHAFFLLSNKIKPYIPSLVMDEQQTIIIPELYGAGIEQWKIDILNDVRKYFSIFKGLEIKIGNNFPTGLQKENTNVVGYLKIHNDNDEILELIPNPIDKKWYPLRKFINFTIVKESAGFVFTGQGIGFSSPILGVIIHEIGHLLNLEHQGEAFDRLGPPRGSLYIPGEYALKNNDLWVPLMGGNTDEPDLEHWSNSDYFNSLKEQNDIKVILDTNSTIELIKKPPIDYKWSTGRNKSGSHPENLSNKTRKILKYVTKNDGDEIEGMLGYPFDFDIYAVLVEPGRLFIQATPENPETTSCSIEILTCDCQLDLKKYGIIKNLNDFGDAYPSFTPSHDFIYLENNSITAENYIYEEGAQNYSENKYPTSSSFTKDFEQTTLIFIKVAGGYLNVDPITKQPNKVRRGISQYGALGKYKLYINRLSKIPDGLKASCKQYHTCNGKYSFFTTKNFSILNEDPNGLRILKQKVVINKKIEEENFLVYGQPIDINAPDPTLPDGSPKGLYLPVIIDGECKKQEFVVGNNFS